MKKKKKKKEVKEEVCEEESEGRPACFAVVLHSDHSRKKSNYHSKLHTYLLLIIGVGC